MQARDRGVVGLGLGGYEVSAPAAPFAHAFQAAREAGLLSVPHAGETEGANSVRAALDQLSADRIGHGVRAIEDKVLLAQLVERQVPLEINPTSNICLKVYPGYTAHPFRALDEAGVLVTVNSDDPPLFDTSLAQEYEVLARHFGYGAADLVRIARNAYSASGVEPALKEQLLAEFDAWAQTALPASLVD